MAKAHEGLNQLTDYLRHKFCWKEPYVCKTEHIDTEFTYAQVLQAMKYLKVTDPELYKLLQYRYLTDKPRNTIANSLYIDSSTLKRKWDKGMQIVQHWLMHGPYSTEEPILEPLDPINFLDE